jgi:hypothetical protein
MKLLDTTPSLYPPAKADAIAAALQAGDDEWTYRAIHDPKGTGFSFVNVYDEDNVLVGRHHD